MKYGVCLGYAQHDRIECAAKCGFDYFEVGFAALTEASDEAFAEFLGALRRLNIPCETANGFLPGRLPVVGEHVDEDALYAFLEKGMQRAQAAGIQVVVFGSGAARSLPDGISYRRGAAQIIHFLQSIAAPIARHYGVRIAIEPLRPAESNIINRVKEGAILAAAVGSETVGVLGDLYHMAHARESASELLDVSGALYHVHISNPALESETPRRYPAAPDEWDYASFLRAAQQSGCPRCSIEASCQNFEQEAPIALKTLRSIEL